MATVTQLATKALSNDFDAATWLTKGEDAVRDAIGRIFRSTSLAAGDYRPAATSLAAGALSFLIDQAGLRVSSIFHVDTGLPLDEVTVDEIAAHQQRPGAAPGRPLFYALTGAGLTAEGITVLIAPVPDAVYSLQVVGSFAPGSTDVEAGDEVPLPRDYEYLPVAWARSELFAWEGDTEQSNVWEGRWQAGLRALRADLQRRSGRVRRVPGTWSGSAGSPRLHHPQGLF